MRLIVLMAATFVAGCGSEVERELTKVQPPQVVTKVVERYRDLPAWATEEVANRPPRNGTVEALKDANNTRALTLDWVNCRARLLAKLEKGQKVNIKDCG